jgi:hypothetical protein
MRKCLTALAMASTIAVAAVVTPATADARSRRPALGGFGASPYYACPYYGYAYSCGPYWGYRYPAHYGPFARRAYEYDHHYGLIPSTARPLGTK